MNERNEEMTGICMATMVDVSEFAINKPADRGSRSARGIVTNAQDFAALLQKGLGLDK